MEKVYDLINESEYFKHLMTAYMRFHSEEHDGNHQTSFYASKEPINCNELLRFGVHHALCGENVYMVQFPRQVEILRRPDNLFFLERWSDFLDISDLDHALVLAIANRNQYDHYRLQETFTHIRTHFKSFVAITVQN